MRRLIRCIAASGTLLFTAACQPTDGETPPSAVDQPANAGANAVSEEQHADHDSHDEAEPRPFLAIMQQLGADMVALTYAIVTQNAAEVSRNAGSIAAHSPISPEDIERISNELGPEMARFEELDEAVHLSSARLRDVAQQTGDMQEVVRQLSEVQSGCVACHDEFRERLRTN